MSKTRKRVLSVLTILFAIALVFTACFALAGCGDSEDDGSTGSTGTSTGTKYTITEAGRYEVGTWVVRYAAVYDDSTAMSDYTKLSGNVFMWAFEGGDLYFATQDYYDSWIVSASAAAGGSTGTWTNTEGALAFYLNTDLMDSTTNADGTLTITGTSMWGTFTVTVNPSDFATA